LLLFEDTSQEQSSVIQKGAQEKGGTHSLELSLFTFSVSLLLVFVSSVLQKDDLLNKPFLDKLG
jgi:hypothetical protein